VDGPLGCGSNESLGFVVSCGGLWCFLVIAWSAPVFRAVSSGVWEPETRLFNCKNVDETWLFVWFLWTFWWWFWKLVAERCGRKADFSAPPFIMRPVNGSGRNDGCLEKTKRRLADGLHPTLRKVREGWGTRSFVIG
jgi:hypothetical protein